MTSLHPPGEGDFLARPNKEHYFVVRSWLNNEGKPQYEIVEDMDNAYALRFMLFSNRTVWNEQTQQWESCGASDDNMRKNEDLLQTLSECLATGMFVCGISTVSYIPTQHAE